MSSPPTGQADWKLLAKAWPYLRPDLPYYIAALVAAPASAGLTILQPYLLKRTIDDAIRVGDLTAVRRFALYYLGAVLAAFVTEALYTLAISYGAMRSITRLREAVYRHTLSLSQSFFDTRPTGRLLTRATSDVDALGETLTAGAITIVLDVLVVASILVAMFTLEPRLTGMMVLAAPVVGFLLDRVRRVLRFLYQEVRTSISELNAFLSERLSGMEIVQLYSAESHVLHQFDTRLVRYRNATVRTNGWDALLYAVVDGVGSVTTAFMLWYGSGGLVDGLLTAGMLVAFIDYTGKLFRPIQEFSAKIAIIQRATSALEKIFGLLDHEEHITPGETPPSASVGEIQVRDLHFAYGDGPEVLKGISLSLRPGEVVALVGRTGSGKTTLAKLLTRTYDGYRGSITLDGQELSGLDPVVVRRTIGMVRQDVQLFPGDVEFNLTLGRSLDEATLTHAITQAHADEAVAKLGGLKGLVAQRGSNLSVGEAQLLSFARTMAHNPPIIILDEATASVDTLTEAKIQAATDAVLARKTVLVIAHRLSTIVHADRILVLEHGAVVEAGTHAELLEIDGRYANLYRQQFSENDARAESA